MGAAVTDENKVTGIAGLHSTAHVQQSQCRGFLNHQHRLDLEIDACDIM